MVNCWQIITIRIKAHCGNINSPETYVLGVTLTDSALECDFGCDFAFFFFFAETIRVFS
jgi:hypothetical protein